MNVKRDVGCKRQRWILVKLRGGTAELRIETGRWCGLIRDEGICKSSDAGEAEDVNVLELAVWVYLCLYLLLYLVLTRITMQFCTSVHWCETVWSTNYYWQHTQPTSTSCWTTFAWLRRGCKWRRWWRWMDDMRWRIWRRWWWWWWTRCVRVLECECRWRSCTGDNLLEARLRFDYY